MTIEKSKKILTRDLEAISEILSRPWKTKIFLVVEKETKPDDVIFVSGYKLSRIANANISSTYGFLDRMVGEYGVFERPQGIKRPGGEDAIRRVKITKYGEYICEKIRSILPSANIL